MVEDQAHAQRFYTEILGFVTSKDIPLGEFRWLTVVSPGGHPDVELLLEPNANPAVPARAFQQALHDAGIPATMFTVDDVRAEYSRLQALGVQFTSEPTTMDGVTTAIFDDTCGNLIMIASA
jgi:catechol 2,3-dioxygenase-like lactoylglutathione lyase family enzyme